MEVSCQELFEAAQEYQVRELSFWVCANMVANALGRCEFRTFRNHQEIQERLKHVKRPNHPAPGVLASYRQCVSGSDQGALWLYGKGE